MKLTPLEGKLQQFFVACRRSDIPPMMVIRSATVDMTVKW
jgi:hypothetical protein